MIDNDLSFDYNKLLEELNEILGSGIIETPKLCSYTCSHNITENLVCSYCGRYLGDILNVGESYYMEIK